MKKILFVCHENICRSVSAQYIFLDMVNRNNIADRFVIEEGCKGLLEYLEGNGQ